MKGCLASCLMVIVLFGSPCICSGQNEPSNAELLKEIEVLKTRIAQLEAKVAQREVKVKKEEPSEPTLPEGLNIGAGATVVVQATHNANCSNNDKEDAIDASYSVDLTIEKEFSDFGLGFVHLEAADGESVEGELEVFSNVNRDNGDSDNHVDLTELWYEHYFRDSQLTLTLGKIDATCYADQNEIANDETAQFLGHIFRNAPTIDFPDNNFGLHALIAPADSWWELQTQIMDGAGDWEDIFDNIFTTYQLNFKPALLDGLSANYRLYGWYKHTNYTEWENSDNQFKHKYGWGLSLDQQLSDNFTIFTRYGWANPDVYDPDIASSSGANYSLGHTWSLGCQLEGDIWGRVDDYLGAAIGLAFPSDEYEKADSARKADTEGHFELYYAWCLNDHLTLSPDLHIIWNPFGSDYIVSNERRDDTITVIGMRGQVDF